MENIIIDMTTEVYVWTPKFFRKLVYANGKWTSTSRGAKIWSITRKSSHGTAVVKTIKCIPLFAALERLNQKEEASMAYIAKADPSHIQILEYAKDVPVQLMETIMNSCGLGDYQYAAKIQSMTIGYAIGAYWDVSSCDVIDSKASMLTIGQILEFCMNGGCQGIQTLKDIANRCCLETDKDVQIAQLTQMVMQLTQEVNMLRSQMANRQ
jgi:hypothetical protein